MRIRLKKIDKLITQGFIGPYLASFFVAEFVLVMQFLWKYIDDILGKGFTVLDLMELIFYYAVTIIPLAIPLTILISSVMVFGDMAEKYELSSMKSAGISLIRIMKAGIIISILTGAFSLFSSNYLKPKANFQFFERFSVMKRQKPSLSVESEIFNKQFTNYVIRVGEKDKDGSTIRDILVYDQTNPDRNLINIIKAKKGEMFTTEEGGNFVMQLKDGIQYKEMTRKYRKDETNKGAKASKSYPFIRTKFKEFTKVFDMSEFDPSKRTINLNRNRHDLMNSWQLKQSIDSLQVEIDNLINTGRFEFAGLVDDPKKQTKLHPRAKKNLEEEKKIKDIEPKEGDIDIPVHKRKSKIKSKKSSSYSLKKQLDLLTETVEFQKPIQDFKRLSHHYESFAPDIKLESLTAAVRTAQAQRDKSFSNKTKKGDYKYLQTKYRLRINQQFSWALVCVLFLFIGAPLGSIIRKGGYGYPLLFAIIFFMIFIITQIMGEKLHRSREMSEYAAAWLPCLLLLPIAIFLTYKAMTDSKILNIDGIIRWIARAKDD
jgi:lipopolysaccharide export system permease protein